MVLESLINIKNLEKQPWKIFLIGIIYSSVAIFLVSLIYEGEFSSIMVVVLTLIPSTPLLYNIIKLEEEKDNLISNERKLLKEHRKAISLYGFLFLGFVISFAWWYTFLPANSTESLYYLQSKTIAEIRFQSDEYIVNPVTGNAVSRGYYFKDIFLNNLAVLGFSIFFPLLYGVGAIYLLTWNASVLGTAVGSFVRNNLENYAAQNGFIGIEQYFSAFSLGLLQYAIHGIPEIIGFIIGALAGGIILVAIIKHEFKWHIFRDSSTLIFIAIVFLFTAYLIEVYVTPQLFGTNNFVKSVL